MLLGNQSDKYLHRWLPPLQDGLLSEATYQASGLQTANKYNKSTFEALWILGQLQSEN